MGMCETPFFLCVVNHFFFVLQCDINCKISLIINFINMFINATCLKLAKSSFRWSIACHSTIISLQGMYIVQKFGVTNIKNVILFSKVVLN